VDNDYRAVNRDLWDERAAAHAASPDYAIARFAADPAYLSHVVRFDLPLLGSVEGLRGVHLQCHIGTDTVSLARLGARMTGLDFSARSVEQARSLAAATGADVDFVVSDVYAALDVLPEAAYDLVFTGVGALCWLPDVRRWASVVARLLAPAGRLFLREAHPVLWALDDARPDGLIALEYPYFERPEPTVWDEEGTYVETDVTFAHHTSVEWNHGLGETVTALVGQMDRLPDGEWRLRDRPWRLPHTFTLQAVRPG